MTLLSQGLIVDYLTSTNCPIWELCCYIIYHMFYVIKFNLFFFINYCVIIHDMSLQKTEQFNKNVVMVYAEDSSFTGYKALEESKINSIASQSSGLLNQLTTLNNKIQTTGNLYSTILVHQMDLNSQFDNVDVGGFAGADISGIKQILSNGIKTYSYSTSTISNYDISGVNGLSLPQDVNRKELFIQNLDTGKLYVKYGASVPSNTSFNFILSANSYQDAGDGGSLNDQSYLGDVYVSGSTPRYISWQRT